MIVAASSGRLDVVVALLEAGVSALAVDETGKTSLHKAAYLNLTQMARELIARELRQTYAARSGRARSHGLVNKAVTVVRRLP